MDFASHKKNMEKPILPVSFENKSEIFSVAQIIQFIREEVANKDLQYNHFANKLVSEEKDWFAIEIIQ